MHIIVLSHSDVVLWQGNYCLSCASLSTHTTRCAEEVPPHILNLGIKRMQVAGFKFGPLYPQGKIPEAIFDRMQSVPARGHIHLYLLQFSNVTRVTFVRFSHKP